MILDFDAALAAVRALPHGMDRLAAATRLVASGREFGSRQYLPTSLLELCESAAGANRPDIQVETFQLAARRYLKFPMEVSHAQRRQLIEMFDQIIMLATNFPECADIHQIDDIFAAITPLWTSGGGTHTDLLRNRAQWAAATGVKNPEPYFAELLAAGAAASDMEMIFDHYARQMASAEAVEAYFRDSVPNFDLSAYGWFCLSLAALSEGFGDLAELTLGRGLRRISDFGDHIYPDSSLERSVLATGKRFELLSRGCSTEEALDYLREVGYIVGDLSDLTAWGSTPLESLMFQLSLIAGLSADLELYGDDEIGVSLDPEITVRDLRDQFIEVANSLAASFDNRNGNSMYSDLLIEAMYPTPLKAGLVSQRPASAHQTRISLVEIDDTSDDLSAEEQLKFAEQCAEVSPTEASQQYAALARKLEERGQDREAGHAYAEAAHCLKSIDDEAAHSLFTLAVARLTLSAQKSSLLLDVLDSWTPIAQSQDMLIDWLRQAHEVCEFDWPTHDEDTSTAHQEYLDRHRLYLTSRFGVRTATAALTQADYLAQTDYSLLLNLTLLAEDSAESLANLGYIREASRGFWASARLNASIGVTDDVHYFLESALEGLSILGDTTARVLVAAELIKSLQSTGMAEEADAVATALLTPPAEEADEI